MIKTYLKEIAKKILKLNSKKSNPHNLNYVMEIPYKSPTKENLRRQKKQEKLPGRKKILAQK